MKTFFKIIAALLLTSLTRLAPAAEPAKNPAATLVPGHSVFVIPASFREGRDPFFPESTRMLEAQAVATKTTEISALTVKGFSGTPGHRFVIINNHTFGIGDEGDVLTPTGRVHIRCTEIHADLVTIEINGQKRDLHLGVQ